MRCSTKYVGLDVHQATTIATVRESSGKVIARSILPTEEAALLEFFAGMRGAVHVAFEEGTQAQWLHDLLSPRVARVVRGPTWAFGKRSGRTEVTHAEEDCSEGPLAPRSLARGGE